MYYVWRWMTLVMLEDDDGDDIDFVRCFTYETRDARDDDSNDGRER